MAMRMGEMLGFVKMDPRIKSIVSLLILEFKILFLFFFWRNNWILLYVAQKMKFEDLEIECFCELR